MGYLFDLLVEKLHYTAMNLHDPLCIGFFIDLESTPDYTQVGWATEERDICIESDGTLTRGMLVIDRRIKCTRDALGAHSRTQVVVKADAERYLASMFYDIWGANYPRGANGAFES
jgi:inosine-uridine nucleoside N-ribohydrolase